MCEEHVSELAQASYGKSSQVREVDLKRQIRHTPELPILGPGSWLQ